MDNTEKFKQVAHILAAEEIANNPSQLANPNLENEIFQVIQEQDKQKQEKHQLLVKYLDKINGIIDDGGSKKIFLRILLYVILPITVLAIVAYILYMLFSKQNIALNLVKSLNNSKIYVDQQTRWKLRVREIVPDVVADQDKANFDVVSGKVKEAYGI